MKIHFFIRRIADEVLMNGKAYDNLRVLTKQIGGRLTASPQMVKAENWGLATMKESGADFTPRGFSFGGSPDQLAKVRSWIPLLLLYGVYQITPGGGGADVNPLTKLLNTPAQSLIPTHNDILSITMHAMTYLKM